MKITIAEIAKMAGVSKATVSMVINKKPKGVSKEKKEQIEKLIEEYSYQPSLIARGLVTKETKSLGLIIPDINNPFFPQLVRGIEDYANKWGYTLLLCNSDKDIDKERKYINAFIEKSIDGVILASNISETTYHIEILKQRQIPFVLLDRYIEGIEYDAGIFIDNVKGGYMATNFLLNRGHSKIAFISGPKSVATSENRFKGYKMALEEKNIKVDMDIVKEGDYLFESGFVRTIELLESGSRITAIFACNDIMAIGAIKAIKKKGFKVPEDIEVVGFDNIDIAQIVEPSLTTVSQPTYDMGTAAAKQLIKLLEGKKLKTKNVVFEPELIIRETTR